MPHKHRFVGTGVIIFSYILLVTKFAFLTNATIPLTFPIPAYSMIVEYVMPYVVPAALLIMLAIGGLPEFQTTLLLLCVICAVGLKHSSVAMTIMECIFTADHILGLLAVHSALRGTQDAAI